MDPKTFELILSVGETVAVEFKRAGNGINSDTYESVCSFLNRFGGDVYLGVLDDGTVVGVPEKVAPDMIQDFVSVISNEDLLYPAVYLAPEVFRFNGRTVIHIHVPSSSEVHSYKKVIYDRVDDADVKVTATGAVAAMYVRKQNVLTEKRIYPYARLDDLRLDLFPRIRQAAINHAQGAHPWRDLDDMELLKSAGLDGRDMSTGETGFNMAAILLLGRDEVIRDVCPTYETDALVREINLERYDDREIIRTNLIESYHLLTDFARKHLPDKFFLEGVDRVSLRDVLVREMISNTLMHREFVSFYSAKFVIMTDRMYTENANRAIKDGLITPANLEPISKNPIIAAFFRNIGRADHLGSGVRNLFKYSRFYSGQEPQFCEGDVFKAVVPLDDSYSYDFALGRDNKVTMHGAGRDNFDTKRGVEGNDSDIKQEANDTKREANDTKRGVKGNDSDAKRESSRSADEALILRLLTEDASLTQGEIQKRTGYSLSKVKRIMSRLKAAGVLARAAEAVAPAYGRYSSKPGIGERVLNERRLCVTVENATQT